MAQGSRSKNQPYDRAKRGLRGALKCYRPNVSFNKHGRAKCLCDNVVSYVARVDFEDDLLAGDGSELGNDPKYGLPKFHAPHSSAALAVNCFAPFRRKIDDLPNLLGKDEAFDSLCFEAKCPTGVKKPDPNLDVLLSGPNNVIAIESKSTEHCSKRSMERDLSSAETYAEKIRDGRREQGYFKEMERLMEAVRLEKENELYKWLHAAQLIKHAFGLVNTYHDRLSADQGFSVTLLYLYWEPAEAERFESFVEHRQEIKDFASYVHGSTPTFPTFKAMSYPELWAKWRDAATGWVSEHLDDLDARYSITI